MRAKKRKNKQELCEVNIERISYQNRMHTHTARHQNVESFFG